MTKHYAIFHCLCLALISMAATCRQPVPVKDPAIFAFFPVLPASDTLHVEISDEADSATTGDTIPNQLFFTTIPAALLQEIDYVADSSEALVLGRQRFPLNDSITAFWVEIRQFWFQHHSLLLYNQHSKTFTNRITLAEWYGGDGGQILIGSWLFDYNGDGKKDIVRQEIQHSMIPGGEEPEERTEASTSLLLWKDGHFSDTPVQDSAAMIRRYPIRSFW